MRLIDADKILDALGIFTDAENGNKHFLCGIWTAKKLIEDALEEQEADMRESKMKIEDCQTVDEFFGVEEGDTIWVEDKEFIVAENSISGVDISMRWNTPALVGCLTGQLKWSRHEPMTDEEENILREIAAWFPSWGTLYLSGGTLYLSGGGNINRRNPNGLCGYPFDDKTDNSKAYTVLAPILEKHGEINLDDYRKMECKEVGS